MKHTTSIILTALATFALVCCIDDLVVDNPSHLYIDESNLINAELGVSVNGFAVNVDGTRAFNEDDHEVPSGDTEEMSDFEKTIDNIWVFQYNTAGTELLSYPRYYTAAESYDPDEDKWEVTLTESESTIYVVANVNDDEWAAQSKAEDFYTPEKLLAQTLPSPDPITDTSEEATNGYIPMQGNVTGVTPGSMMIVVHVEHMYAKVKMRFIIDRDLAEVDSVKITNIRYTNIPWYCQVATLYEESSGASKDNIYPSTNWTSRYFNEINNTDDPNNEGLKNTYDYVIYTPENIQGEVALDAEVDTVKNEKATREDTPQHASMITTYISYIDENKVNRTASYTICPGGNDYNNYNIRRNQVYRVTMNIGYPEEIEREPSANCLFGYAGTTISFYPYYRVESGGGYHFSDYLSPNAGSGTGQKIGGLKIIWQTKDCIGNNSTGDKVYLISMTGDVITGQDVTHNGYEQICVETSKEGNALIAAYADADCKGDIIWSWHIWVRDPQYSDPTNLANAMAYYTYDWDQRRIYSYQYYVDTLRTTPTRVPGYQIMSCNIGALQDEPNWDNCTFLGDTINSTADNNAHLQKFNDEDGIVRTFGMMYQWGRKDPFPPLTTTEGPIGNNQNGLNTGYYVHDYNDAHTEQLYGNDNTTAVHKTSFDQSGPTYAGADTQYNNNYLFYSHIHNATMDGKGMEYTIKHPTVFLCGTDTIARTLTHTFEIKQSSTSSTLGRADSTQYVQALCHYLYKGGWAEDDEFDSGEWGGIDIQSSGKTLQLGFQDQQGNPINLYDDYGTQKSIFDPCPYGWRVSSGDLFLGFTKNGVNALWDYTKQNQYDPVTGTNTAASNTYEYGSHFNMNCDSLKSCMLGVSLYLGANWRQGQTSWFPTQGFILPDGSAYRVGGCGNYVNANVDADPLEVYDRVYVTHVHWSIDTFRVFEHQLQYTVKAAASPLRCVRDTK